jgi:hypothetical protein
VKEAVVTKSFRVGKRTATMTIPIKGGMACMTCEWHPHKPRRLSKKEPSRYRAGRNATMLEVLKRMGGGNGPIWHEIV